MAAQVTCLQSSSCLLGQTFCPHGGARAGMAGGSVFAWGVFFPCSGEHLTCEHPPALGFVLCCMGEAPGFHLLTLQIFVSAWCAPSAGLPLGMGKKVI